MYIWVLIISISESWQREWNDWRALFDRNPITTSELFALIRVWVVTASSWAVVTGACDSSTWPTPLGPRCSFQPPLIPAVRAVPALCLSESTGESYIRSLSVCVCHLNKTQFVNLQHSIVVTSAHLLQVPITHNYISKHS